MLRVSHLSGFGKKVTAGAPPPWSPSDLTQAIARYKASEIVGLSDTDPVDTWEDIIGSFDATSSSTARPLYRTGGGAPYVEFDGSDDYMDTTLTTAFGDFAVFLVFRMFNMTEAASRLLDKKYDTGFWIGTDVSSGGNLGGGILESGSPFGDFYTASANTWYAMLFQRNGTTKTIRFEGSTNNDTVSSSALDTSPLLIGREAATPTTHGQADFKEIVICNDDISGADLSKLISYASDEYGLTL